MESAGPVLKYSFHFMYLNFVLHSIIGSTNAVIRSIHGTEDVETAAIHIALGRCIS